MVIRKIIYKANKILKRRDEEFKKFQKISYSQSGEDILIDYIFKLRKINKPTYLDLGSNHPFNFNNTFLFYNRGSRGVNVDANPELIKLFVNQRPEDININLGIGEKPGQLTFFVLSEPLLSTFSEEEALMHISHGVTISSKISMKIKTVNEIIDEYCGSQYPDLLSIDVEGIDELVISSMDFKRSKPKVICIETVDYTPDGKGKKRKELIQKIIDEGFTNFADTNINTIFVENNFWYNYK